VLTTGPVLEQYHGGAMSHPMTALVTAGVRLTGGIIPGIVFMPFHFAEAAANLLTHAALDPVARIPEYKICAVAVEPTEVASAACEEPR